MASLRRRNAAAWRIGWRRTTNIGNSCATWIRPGKRSNALPTTAVDDGFARTTIELACVAAQEDLSQRTAQVAAENRGRMRWWIAAGVAAAVIAFVMVRALAVHRNNALLADLPVIGQLNALEHVTDVEFLRQLSAANVVG